MADMIAVMNQGVIEQIGTPQEIYHRPRSMFVAEFIGSPADELPATARPATGRRCRWPGGRCRAVPELREAAPGRLVLGVRPEHVRFSDDGAGPRRRCSAPNIWAPARLSPSTPSTGGCEARARTPSVASIGETVGLAFEPGQLILFDAHERAGALPYRPVSSGRSPWLRCASPASASVRRHRRRRCRSTLAINDGEFVVLLGRPAPARPRRCA